MRSVTFLKSVTGGEGESLNEGETHSLNDASADHWIKRGIAIHAETNRLIVGKTEAAPEVNKPQADDLKEEPKPEPKLHAKKK